MAIFRPPSLAPGTWPVLARSQTGKRKPDGSMPLSRCSERKMPALAAWIRKASSLSGSDPQCNFQPFPVTLFRLLLSWLLWRWSSETCAMNCNDIPLARRSLGQLEPEYEVAGGDHWSCGYRVGRSGDLQ